MVFKITFRTQMFLSRLYTSYLEKNRAEEGFSTIISK